MLNLIRAKLLLFRRYWISTGITSTNSALSLITSWHKAFMRAKLVLQGLFTSPGAWNILSQLSALAHAVLMSKKTSLVFMHPTLKNLPKNQCSSQTKLQESFHDPCSHMWFLPSLNHVIILYSILQLGLNYVHVCVIHYLTSLNLMTLFS